MEKQIFVAREHELTQLDDFIKKALAGQGMVCFVTGEAGSGKTTLVTEFARRALEQHKDLVVAVGQSDAQTGAGDPYLPFREVLRQLTGDVETKLAKGAISAENENRLRKMVGVSARFLVEIAPDLVGLFVPGAGLAMKAAKATADKAGWLGKLEKLSQRPKAGEGLGSKDLDQNMVFEQYTRFVTTLADKSPLLLILDDLQWADSASIGLLFRLGRRIEGHRILIMGTYRPEEVAIGRVGERHPLEKVLTELKRYYGDIWVDLDQAEQVGGKQFVNAFLNTEPNQLKEEFCQKLFQHTGGHPLFTIELLRNMQERGDLVRNAQGLWVETSALDWESLPKRVEGVIEERINRLGQDLRRLLTVGSVEGEDFTAEVVARVQSADVRGLIPKLSEELERQHRLVKSQGIRRVNPDGQRLSMYRFQHNLFQTYLYNELDEAERAYLHEDVGNALETLYGDQVDEIAVQLVRHFNLAGMVEKACTYLERSGKQAADRYANDEAVSYFSRALDLTPENKPDQRYTLLLAREKIYGLQGKRELQVKDLAALQALVQILGDDRKRTEIALQQAAFAHATSDYPAAVAAAQEAIRLAEAVQDTRTQAGGHLMWGRATLSQGDYETARCQLDQALALSWVAELRQVQASSLRALGVLAVRQGDHGTAKTYYKEALRLFCEEGDRTGESTTLINLANVFSEQGDWASARGYEEQGLAIVRETGDRQGEGILLGNLGANAARQGDLQAARTYFEQSRLTSHGVGDRDCESLMLCNLGEVSALLGDLSAARGQFEQALLLVREIGGQLNEAPFLNELGRVLAWQGDYSAADEYCGQSLHIARERGDRRGEALALSSLGLISDCEGDYADALDHFKASLEIACSIGLRPQEGEAVANLGLLYHHLGEDQAAQEHCQLALEIAKELGARDIKANGVTHLGHALVGLGLLAEATDSYQHSLLLRRELGQLHLTTESLAGLARISLIKNNPGEAQEFINEILGYLENHTLDGTEEPMRVYLTCYRVLMANHDKRARDILNTAYKLLQERATKIKNDEMRISYLENVVAHREIIQEYTKTG